MKAIYLLVIMISLTGCYKAKDPEMYARPDRVPEQSFDTIVTDGTAAVGPKVVFCDSQPTWVIMDSFGRVFYPDSMGVGGLSWVYQINKRLGFDPARVFKSNSRSGGTSTDLLAMLNAMGDPSMKRNFVIGAGRNNYKTIHICLSDIRAMVTRIRRVGGHNRIIIITPSAGDTESEYKGGYNYTKLKALSDSLKAEYPGQVYDEWGAMVKRSALLSSVTETFFYEREIPSPRFRKDWLHRNTAGYAAMAEDIDRMIIWEPCN